jgi:hypothetical protein
MADLKTQPNEITIGQLLAGVAARQKPDTDTLLDLMREVTGFEPVVWGTSIIGFGQYRYTYASGWRGTFFRTGFAPRMRNFSIYIMPGFDNYADLLRELGKHRKAKSCLYINKLADIDLSVLRTLISRSVADMATLYPD